MKFLNMPMNVQFGQNYSFFYKPTPFFPLYDEPLPMYPNYRAEQQASRGAQSHGTPYEPCPSNFDPRQRQKHLSRSLAPHLVVKFGLPSE